MKKMNNTQKFFRDKWIIEVDSLIKDLIEHPSSNSLYQEKNLMAIKALKTFLNFLINNECYDYMNLYQASRVLTRLHRGLPLTPIQDTPDEWFSRPNDQNGEILTYTSLRYPSLSKIVNTRTGEIVFRDREQFKASFLRTKQIQFHSTMVDDIASKFFPIKMPYYPEDKPISIIIEEFLYDPKHGGFNTISILYAEHDSGLKTRINKFFKETYTPRIVYKEISRLEYILRFLYIVIFRKIIKPGESLI